MTRRTTAGRARRTVSQLVQFLRQLADSPEMRRWKREGGIARLFEHDLGPGSTVVDVGAYEGWWASEMFSRYLSTIHLFEPVSAFAAVAEERFRRNDRILVHPVGLAGTTRIAALSIEADRSSEHFGAGSAVEECPLEAAGDAFDRLGITEVDVMKVNIEGGEYELLDHLVATGRIERVARLMVQFHEDFPDAPARLAAIREGLARTHERTWCYEYLWESWDRR